MFRVTFLFLLLLFGCRTGAVNEPICQSQLVAFGDDDLSVLFVKNNSPLTREDVHRLDRHYPKTLKKINRNEPLQPQDIIHLTRAGVADPVILEIMKATESTFTLTAAEEQRLKQAGVSNKVIMAMKLKI